jgi:hypothetical protein
MEMGERSGYKHSGSGDIKVKAYAQEIIVLNPAVPAAIDNMKSRSLR